MNLATVASIIDLQAVLDAIPGNHLVLLPDAPSYTIIGVTESLLHATYRTRDQLVGKPLFDVFPDNVSDVKATGKANVRSSLDYVVQYKIMHQLPQQRYDIENPATGAFEYRVWAAANKPVMDKNGAVQCIIHTTEDITDKVKLQEENAVKEKKLQESESRFRQMVEQAPVPILLSRGEDLVIENLNRLMLKAMNKASFDEVLGKPIVEVMPELKEQAILQTVKNVQKTGVPFRGYEVPTDVLIEGKLERFYFDYFYTPIKEGTDITGVLHMALDVTPQVKARIKLEEANEELQFVTDNIPQLAWASTAEGYSYFFNKGWLDFTGLSLEAVKGNGWTQSLHPDDLDRTNDAWTNAYKNGAAYDIEYRLRRKDGVYRWFLTRATPMKDEEGKILKWYGTTTDVHEQKEAHKAVLESTERFELVSKATQDAIWDWNLLTDEVTWNNSVKKLFGYREEEVVKHAHWWYEHVHAEDRDHAIKELQTVFETKGSSCTREYRFLCADGSYKTVLDRGFILQDEDGKPVRIIGSMQDITARKRAEEALRKSEEELEKKVEERTIALAQANEELKRSNQNLEDFAYAASHDLKEPVRKIHVFSERLKNSLGDKLSEAERQYFNRMELASRRMNTLIDDLLLYSEVSQTAVLNEMVDLNQIINFVLVDLDLEIEDRQAVIKVDKLFMLKGHRRQLQQAFQNLIGNALKYSKPDVAPLIHIAYNAVSGSETGLTLTAEEQAKKFYQLTIKDNGIGFDQEDADRIFNVFTRLHGMAEYKGTGVGLSIVRKIIENHKGHIWATSQPGEGATFTLLFPADDLMAH